MTFRTNEQARTAVPSLLATIMNEQIGYRRISLILYLFSYFFLDSYSNTDSVNHDVYDMIGY